MILIFLGAPGSGKGTQSELLQKQGWVVIGTGNIFRNLSQSSFSYAKKVRELLAKGILIPDELTLQLVKEELIKVIKKSKNIVLDGCIRTLEQAQGFEKIMSDLKISKYKVVLFDIEKKEVIRRLSNRLTCPKCFAIYHSETKKPKKEGICDNCQTKLIKRDDDLPKAIEKRFEEYNNKTKPIIEFYQDKNKLLPINSNKPFLEVNNELLNIIKRS